MERIKRTKQETIDYFKMNIKRFEIVGDTETNGLGDYDFTMLIDDGTQEDIVIVGSYVEDDNNLVFVPIDEITDKQQEAIEKFFKTDRKDIIEAIKRSVQ